MVGRGYAKVVTLFITLQIKNETEIRMTDAISQQQSTLHRREVAMEGLTWQEWHVPMVLAL